MVKTKLLFKNKNSRRPVRKAVRGKVVVGRFGLTKHKFYSLKKAILFASGFAVAGALLLYFVFAAGVSQPDEADQSVRINNYRSQKGLNTLTVSNCLSRAARAHSQHMFEFGKLHHSNGSDGKGTMIDNSDPGLAQLIKNYCTDQWTGTVGENVGVGGSSESLFKAFSESPTHESNILLQANVLGMGVFKDDQGRLWMTQIFATCNQCSADWYGGQPGGGTNTAATTVQNGVATAVRNDGGSWVVDSAGKVSAFAPAAHRGDMAGQALNKPIVGMAATPSGNGYWLVASDGGIFTFGDAPFLGSTGGMALNAPIVGMARTDSGNGYWLVASDGGIFTFGDAPYHGSLGGQPLNAPIIGMQGSSNGYWLLASDGGIFTYGNAAFYGSAGGMALNAPIVAFTVRTDGQGYWLVARDGGIFTYGAAGFYGSAGDAGLTKPIVGIVRSADNAGYFIVQSDGTVINYGSAQQVYGIQQTYVNSPPSAPASLGGVWNTPTSVSFTWAGSSDNRGVREYRIFRNGSLVGTTLGTGYTNSGLTSSTSYNFQISATDYEGAESGRSNTATIGTKPSGDGAPLQISYTSAFPGVPVPLECSSLNEPGDPYTWQDNVVCANKNTGMRFSYTGQLANMDCIEIWEPSDPVWANYRDNFLCVPAGTNAALGLAWSYAGPIGGKNCVNVSESAEPVSYGWADNYLCWYNNTPPSTPTDFRTSAVSGTSVALAWSASTDNKGVKEYRIFRNGQQVGTTTGTTYTASGLTKRTNYTFDVQAVDTETLTSGKATLQTTTNSSSKRL